MECSLVASENTKGRLVLDGGNELLAKRLENIQKRKTDAERQEQKKQYINALIRLAQSEFDISKEELHAMTVPEFNALNKRIHNNASKARLRCNIEISICFFSLFSMIGSAIYALAMHSWISLLFFSVSLIVFIIICNLLGNNIGHDTNYSVIVDNKKFVEEILPSDIQ